MTIADILGNDAESVVEGIATRFNVKLDSPSWLVSQSTVFKSKPMCHCGKAPVYGWGECWGCLNSHSM